MRKYKYSDMILGVLGIFLFATMLFAMQTPSFFLDQWGESFAQFWQSSGLEKFLIVISQIMSFPVIFILGITVFGIFYFYRRRDARRLLFFYTVTICFGSLLVQVIKFTLQRVRPLEPLLEVTGYSFPSGHSFSAMVIYGYFILLLQHYVSRPCWKWGGTILLCFLILITGYSRIYLKAHYLTDVLAGYGLGIFALAITHYFLKQERRQNDEKKLD